jgi:hypothetical protein
MKNLNFLIILMLCYSVSISAAQLRKASDYFPLQVGNVWEYKPNPDFYPDRHIEIVGDTLLGDTLKIYKTLIYYTDHPEAGTGFNYYHYNSDSTVVYKDIEFPQTAYTGLPMIDTGHGIGHRWLYIWGDCICTFAVTDTGSALIFNQLLPWLDVYTIIPEYDSLVIDPSEHFRFVAGIGPTGVGADTLVYAKINGVIYGKPMSVGGEHHGPAAIPREIDLQIYPNPVSGSTIISVDKIVQGEIEIKVIDVLGRTVRTITSQSNIAGPMKMLWDGKDNRGSFLPNGIYFVALKQNNLLKTQKIVFLR